MEGPFFILFILILLASIGSGSGGNKDHHLTQHPSQPSSCSPTKCFSPPRSCFFARRISSHRISCGVQLIDLEQIGRLLVFPSRTACRNFTAHKTPNLTTHFHSCAALALRELLLRWKLRNVPFGEEKAHYRTLQFRIRRPAPHNHRAGNPLGGVER